MPQMAPMWWTCLMLLFNMVFLILITKIYFNENRTINSMMKMTKIQMNWKW